MCFTVVFVKASSVDGTNLSYTSYPTLAESILNALALRTQSLTILNLFPDSQSLRLSSQAEFFNPIILKCSTCSTCHFSEWMIVIYCFLYLLYMLSVCRLKGLPCIPHNFFSCIIVLILVQLSFFLIINHQNVILFKCMTWSGEKWTSPMYSFLHSFYAFNVHFVRIQPIYLTSRNQ